MRTVLRIISDLTPEKEEAVLCKVLQVSDITKIRSRMRALNVPGRTKICYAFSSSSFWRTFQRHTAENPERNRDELFAEAHNLHSENALAATRKIIQYGGLFEDWLLWWLMEHMDIRRLNHILHEHGISAEVTFRI